MKKILALLLVVTPGVASADKAFDSGRGATWDCAKDPNVAINVSGGTYTFKGACSEINVNGSTNKVVIESVNELNVNGSKVTVTAGAVDEINVNGLGNTVTYKKAVTAAKPAISDNGMRNTISVDAAAGATATASTTTTTTTSATVAAAADATVLDCGKQKNQSILKGKGSYRIIGACEKIAITGGDNRATIESVKHLAISGSNNQLEVDKADKIAATGANNKVTFKGGVTLASPKVASLGKGNAIVQAGGTTTAVTTTTTTTTAAASTVDCSKTSTFSIDDNDGSYVLTGKCERVSIAGNHNTVKIESTKAVSVSGNKNTVEVIAVDVLSVPGNTNTVSYKKPSTAAKVKVSALGNGNKVTSK